MTSKPTHELVGHDHPRKDGVARVTGRERYTVDIDSTLTTPNWKRRREWQYSDRGGRVALRWSVDGGDQSSRSTRRGGTIFNA